jgi:hypothetical protein
MLIILFFEASIAMSSANEPMRVWFIVGMSAVKLL